MSTAVKQLDLPAPQVPQPASETGAVLQIIERAARDPSVDIGKMRELLAMRNEMMAFEAKRDFQMAMTAAQIEMRPIVANAASDKNRYATFEAVDGALRPIYTRHGFSLSYGTGDGAPPDQVRITCQVSHISGHSEQFFIDMPTDGKGAKGNDVMTKTHAMGAAMTYGRRYLQGMIFNVTITKDDDGKSASIGDMAMSITADQFRELQDLLEESGSKEADMLAYIKATSVEEMTLAQYAKAKSAMVHKIKMKKQKAGRP